MDTFPFKKLYLRESTIRERFENLKKYPVNVQTLNRPYYITNIPNIPRWMKGFGGKNIAFVFESKDYFTYNEISDFFTEQHRIFANRIGDVSLLEYWEKNKDTKYSQKERTPQELFELREELSSDFYEVGTFRPVIAKCVVELLELNCSSLKVMDFSAGWGCRLIAFLALGVYEYVGIDPNESLHKEYETITKFFDHNTKTTFIPSPFEELDVGMYDSYFDLVFTSPPYFNLETYTQNPSQSITKFPELDIWYNHFLLSCCKKAVKCLKPGGYLVLALNNSGKNSQDYVVRLVNDLSNTKNIKYRGLVPYSEMKGDKLKSPQPVWFFQRLF